MSRMPLYARTFPYSAEVVGFVQAVNGRHWVGIGTERNGNDSLLAVAEGAEWGLERIPFE